MQASPPDVVAQLKDATGAQAAATAYYESLTEKGIKLRTKVEEAQADVAALERALVSALLKRKDADERLEAVKRLVGATVQATGPTIAPTTQAAAPYSTYCALARQLESLSTPGAEATVKLDMQAFAAKIGCTTIADFPMAEYFKRQLSDWLKAAPGATLETPASVPVPVVQAPTWAATTPVPVHVTATVTAAAVASLAPTARPANAPTEGGEDSRLKHREPGKVESLAVPSQSRALRRTAIQTERDEIRQRIHADSRRQSELDAEDAAEFSDTEAAS